MKGEGTPNLFRSEPMSYVHLYMDNDGSQDIVRELGRLSLVEFRDLNSNVTAFQRTYVSEIKRCEEIERKLRRIHEVIELSGVKASTNTNTPVPTTLNDIEALVENWESVHDAKRHYDVLKKSLDQRSEQRVVITKCAEMLSGASQVDLSETPREGESLASQDGARGDIQGMSRLGQVCGCINDSAVTTFERIVFRTARGNCLIQFSPIKDPIIDSKTGVETKKTVFMVFFAGSVLERKLTRIAETFGATIFDFQQSPTQRQQQITQLDREIREISAVLERTKVDRNKLASDVAAKLTAVENKIWEEKSVYHTLNMCERKEGSKGVHAEGWCTSRSIPSVRAAIDRVAREKDFPCPILNSNEAELPQGGGHGHGVAEQPPTYFRTNKLTSGFQAIVDAYGVADYQEFNPMPFSVITFPFLFAVMFGDFGHGLLMFLFALFMIFKEKHFLAHPPGEIFGICFGGRYVILLMSLFSMYTGLLYNDTFALSFDWWKSEVYSPICDHETAHGCEKYHFTNYFIKGKAEIYNPDANVYPFGLDPIWKQATNELSFTNSLKMKLSIVLGVTQMAFGVILSGFNHVHFNNRISLFHEFIPQIIFLLSVFGYMVVLIFVKWSTYYENTHCAPSILTIFIDMFLGFGAVNFEEGCEEYAELIPYQSTVERVLMLLAFVSVPWMLLTKPLMLKAQHEKAHAEYAKHVDEADPEFAEPHAHHDDNFEFGEIMVHQIIHTIEYVLGTVSNTASYLRLWALSLAHAQLSTVFWEKVMVDQLHTGNPALIVVGFMIWVCCTFAVLMVMESLSAFLHALRLHWVEFQGKFYHGAGTMFRPFSFVRRKFD